MDPDDTPDQAIHKQQTACNRICIVIGVMACIISGFVILLAVSLKRNHDFASILDQYPIKLQLPPNVINGAVLSAASSNEPIMPKQLQHLKHAVLGANRTRQDAAQLGYHNAPQAGNFKTGKKLLPNSSFPITGQHGERAQDLSDSLAGARNIQQ